MTQGARLRGIGIDEALAGVCDVLPDARPIPEAGCEVAGHRDLTGVGQDRLALVELVRHGDADAEQAIGDVLGDVGLKQVALLAVLEFP